MNVVSIVGARPQFVKAATVSRALREAGINEIVVHTGQHYDYNMSRQFFTELAIPEPSHNLGVGSGSHAYQVAETMKRLEPVIAEADPDCVIVFGDTNSTIAGAVTAAKLQVPVAHVEAGLRSGDRAMPEEINRIVADRVSTLLFCPSDLAVRNLAAEGIRDGVHNTGDVMFDAMLSFGPVARRESKILEKLDLTERSFVLATIHRNFNTDDHKRLAAIVDGLLASRTTVLLAAHPRLRKELEAAGLLKAIEDSAAVRLTDPVGYWDMLRLEMAARMILTDSGGIQKEALFCRVPCITVRPATEWKETVETGWNRLVEADAVEIAAALNSPAAGGDPDAAPYGNGRAAQRIAAILKTGTG